MTGSCCAGPDHGRSTDLATISSFAYNLDVENWSLQYSGVFKLRFGTKIRSAAPQDLAAIKEVIDATGLFPSEYLDEMFTGNSEPQEDQEFWLTFDDNGPCAVAYCAPELMTNGTWNLLLIAVHPDHQNRGIGRQLMSTVENILKMMGVRILLVETSGTDDFVRTRSFYDQIGYTNEACIRDFYDSGDDKIVFRKAL